MAGFNLFFFPKQKPVQKDNNLDTLELDLLETSGSNLNSPLRTPSVYIKAGYRGVLALFIFLQRRDVAFFPSLCLA